MKYRNVITKVNDIRIANIINGQWVSISAGCARLEGREISMNPHGTQCDGAWMRGQSVTDEKTGETYSDSRTTKIEPTT